MILHIDFKGFFLSDSLVKQEKIPCLIQVSENFNILFPELFPSVIGTISDWDWSLLDERAPGRVGGDYTHQEPGMITLNELSKNTYQVIDLHVFYPLHGWCKIIENKEYATPNNFYGNDEDDPVYMERIAKEKKLKDKC
jgi:hypothetical protein